MKDQQPAELEQALWLSPEDQARLAAFKAYAVNHALLEDVDTRLTQAILEPAGFAHLLVYGPSGVGKTTMLRRTERQVRELYAHVSTPSDAAVQWRYLQGSPALPAQPLLVLEARPPDGLTFNRADYYRSALTALGESYYKQWSLVDIHVDQTWETKTRSKSTGRVAQFNDSPELRHALEETLVRRGVRAVIVDEAQHLMKVASGAKLLDQLDWIKSMTNMTNVVYIKYNLNSRRRLVTPMNAFCGRMKKAGLFITSVQKELFHARYSLGVLPPGCTIRACTNVADHAEKFAISSDHH